MKPLALFLTAVIVYISCFAGIVKPAIAPDKNDCCKHAKTTCHRQSKQKRQGNDGCDQPGCATMFSCSVCGFFIRQPFILQPLTAEFLPKPVVHYISGHLAAYHPDNWKPPKTC